MLLVMENITEISTLRAIIPICGKCKKVRNEAEYWEQVDKYFHDHIGVDSPMDFVPNVCSKSTAHISPRQMNQPTSRAFFLIV